MFVRPSVKEEFFFNFVDLSLLPVESFDLKGSANEARMEALASETLSSRESFGLQLLLSARLKFLWLEKSTCAEFVDVETLTALLGTKLLEKSCFLLNNNNKNIIISIYKKMKQLKYETKKILLLMI